MDVIVTILLFLAVLTVVVLVHEFGHFATAKAFGIKVNEFGWGMPPRLLRLFRKGDTEYTINLIPIGGFVRLEGENDPTHPRSFANKGVGVRFIVLTAGVFMNMVLAVVLLAGLFMFTVDELRVGDVSPGSPAELAGVLLDDTILEVNGTKVDEFDELAEQIDSNRGTEIEWLIRRDGVERRVSLVPRVDPPPDQGATGIRVDIVGTQKSHITRPPWEAVGLGLERTWLVLDATKDEVGRWVSLEKAPEVSGPIGIGQLTGEVTREAGLVSLVPLAALLSIVVAIFNILPFPALDGGRVVFVALEWVRRGKRIPPEKEGLIHLAGFAVLIGILVIASYNDIVRIVEGGSLLP